MRASVVTMALFLSATLVTAHSPGPATDPIPAATQDLQDYIGVTVALHDLWVDLDAACDPDAVFALLYLITTAEMGYMVADSYFEDNPALVAWDADFASRYLWAHETHHAGGEAPEPWVLAFEHADSGNSTAFQDLFAGVSAHVNYDLSRSTYHMQYPQEGRKDDFDRVNDGFGGVMAGAYDQLGARYDPSLGRDGNGTSPLDDVVVAALVSWRDNAWLNAQALADAPDQTTFHAIEATIEAEAITAGTAFTQPSGATAAERTAYCQASGNPPQPAHLGGPGYGDEWIRGSGEDFLICHAPGANQRTMTVDEHSWGAHEAHGDARGNCA